MTDALGWIERLRGADSQLFSGGSGTAGVLASSRGPAGTSTLAVSQGLTMENQGAMGGRVASSATGGLASSVSSSEFGAPVGIGGVRASPAAAGGAGSARAGPAYTAAANDASSSASGAPGSGNAFKDFFHGRQDDTHPAPRVYAGRPDMGDDIRASMLRVNESRGRASSGELQDMEMGGRDRGGSVGGQEANRTSRSSHWNVTDGDLYKLVNSYLQSQKD